VNVNLKSVSQEVLTDLSDQIERSGGEVLVGDLPQIEAEPVQMRQLLQNLISNALKFRKPDVPPMVRVDSEIVQTSIDHHPPELICRLTVRDNGIGFDEKYLDRIFQVFQRLHGRQEFEGTGVGLAVCRKIVERHGGDITAHSNDGEGAEFIITLPVIHKRKGSELHERDETSHHYSDGR
jgi:signal transduction histidine kinase